MHLAGAETSCGPARRAQARGPWKRPRAGRDIGSTATASAPSSGGHYPETWISSRQWSLVPHSSMEFSARTSTLSWKPRDAKA